MFTKLLFTAAVIGIAYLFVKGRAQRVQQVRERQVRHTPAEEEPAPPRMPRLLAYGLLVIMLTGSAGFIFLQWRDQYKIVTIRVVNTNTGGSVTYQARRGDVENRGFETTDGRRIVLAAVERMELGSR